MNATNVTNKEVAGIAVGAAAIAAGLQKLYEVKRWTVPTPVWLAVTSGLTYAGWLGYKKATS